jgi:glycosyltransferase involved in cell wall biosynthesis
MQSLARALYRAATGAATLAALPLRPGDGRVAVFYGGARGGDRGGPLVKVSQLATRFGDHRFGFSLLYMLSNAIYLPRPVVDAVRRAGIPVILNQNGVFYPAWYPQGWERENARMAKVHAAASHVLYQSDFCRRCAERFLGAREGSGEVLTNAVDTARFVPPPPGAPAIARGPRPFTFLLTGKIGPATGYRLLSSIEGLAAVRRGGLDVRLTVAGAIAAPVISAASALAERLGVGAAVTFLGPYAHAQAPAIYQAADAYLMTKHNDPCPNVVLEALACGLPVLHSASGGVPELVGEAGVGLPVPETFDDTPVPAAGAIAEGMARIIGEHAAMAAAARARAMARFSLAAWLDRHEALFKALLHRR